MEKVMRGTTITKSKSASAKTSFCELFVLVKKGHEECGDSAFAFCDEDKAVIGVFDGVSGEAGAASASSQAADAVLACLKKTGKCDDKKMREAISKAQNAIDNGFTTAVILFVEKDGSFVIASIGDSPAYGINSEGNVELELPLARAVGSGDSLFKFLHFRNLVTSVMGPGGGEASLHVRKGKLKKGEMFLLASDGLSDNLWLKVKEGYVVDCSGSDDLKKMVGKKKSPKKIVQKLAAEMEKRIRGGRKEEKDSLLDPKTDDIAMAVITFIK